MSARAAVAGKLQELWQNMKIHESAMLSFHDPEPLHDFRVNLRASRSLLAQTRVLLPLKPYLHCKTEFTWLAHITSELRDIDVFLQHFDTHRSVLPLNYRAGLQQLHRHLLQRQQAEQFKLSVSLNTRHYQKFKNEYDTLLSTTRSDTSADDTTVYDLSRKTIWRAYKKFRRLGKTVSDTTPITDLHELRKLGKKLRYLVQAFADLYPHKAIGRMLKLLKQLQDVLGALVDLDVQSRLLQTWQKQISARSAATDEAILHLVNHLEQQLPARRDDFEQAHAQFFRPKHHRLFKQLF